MWCVGLLSIWTCFDVPCEVLTLFVKRHPAKTQLKKQNFISFNLRGLSGKNCESSLVFGLLIYGVFPLHLSSTPSSFSFIFFQNFCQFQPSFLSISYFILFWVVFKVQFLSSVSHQWPIFLPYLSHSETSQCCFNGPS